MVAEAVEDLRGSLGRTSVGDLLQFLHASGATGELAVVDVSGTLTARAYFDDGELVHVLLGDASGLDALTSLMSWGDGVFRFSSEVLCPTRSISASLQAALVEAARRLDEAAHRQPEAAPEPADRAAAALERLVESTGALVAVFRLGEQTTTATAESGAPDLEPVSSGVSEVLAAVAGLSAGLDAGSLREMMVTFDRFEVMVAPVGEGRLVVVAPADRRVGVVRHRSQQVAAELAEICGLGKQP